MKVLTFDLGGTRLKAGVVEDTTVLANEAAVVAGFDAEAALAAVAGVGARLVERTGSVRAVGLAVPGVVDAGRVTVLPGKFDGVVGRDLGAWLRDTFAVPTAAVANDALANAVGEVTAWSGEGVTRAVVLTIGTGVGCTVLEHGHPVLAGPHGAGMLGGHLPIADPTGPLDTAGRAGTFEARCRADRIVEEAREHGCDADDVPAVYAAAAAGDPAARAGLAEYRRWLVRGLVAMTHAYAPTHVLVGGGPMADGSPLLDGVEAALRDQVWEGTCPVVRPTRRGEDAALLGIAALATEQQP